MDTSKTSLSSQIYKNIAKKHPEYSNARIYATTRNIMLEIEKRNTLTAKEKA